MNSTETSSRFTGISLFFSFFLFVFFFPFLHGILREVFPWLAFDDISVVPLLVVNEDRSRREAGSAGIQEAWICRGCLRERIRGFILKLTKNST